MKIFTLTALFILACGWSSAQSKMAHLNSQEVLAAMPEYTKAVAQLKAFEAEGYAELDAMVAEFQKAVGVFQELAPDRSPVINQIEEEKLNKKQVAVQEREQMLKQEVDAYSRELNQPILAKFNLAVKNVSDREKYDYVVDVSVLMVSNGTDITKLVIAEVLSLTNTPPPQEVIRPAGN
jgi:outer membrane protein